MADVRLRRAYVELNARVGRYESALRQARRDNERFDKSLRNIRRELRETNSGFNLAAKGAGALRTAFAGIAVGFSLNAIRSAVQESATYGATLVETARGIGITTEELERLRFAFQSDGVAQGQTDKLLRQLLRTYDEAREGIKEYRDEYERLGFTQEDFASDQTNIIDLIKRVNDGLLELQDTAAQTNVLQNIAGRSGPVALAAFQQGRIADIARSEELRTTLDPARLKEIDQQILNMEHSWGVFRRSLVATFSPEVLAGLRLFTNISDAIGEKFRNVAPTLDEIERLGNRQLFNLSDAESQLDEVRRLSDVTRGILERALSEDASAVEIAAIDGLEKRLIELAVVYGRTERAVISFREQSRKDIQPNVDAFKSDFTSINSLISDTEKSLSEFLLNPPQLNYEPSLQEIQRLNQAIENPAQLTGIDTTFARVESSIEPFLRSLSTTADIMREIDSLRLDLRLENGEITIEQYSRLKTEIEAVNQLRAEGISVDDNQDILSDRIALLTQQKELQDDINFAQSETNELLRASQFAAKRFSDGLANVVFESRSALDLISGIAVELGKAALRATVLNPFSGFLSGLFGGGQVPISRQFGGTFFAGRNAYVINETGAERLTATRVISNSNTRNLTNNSQPSINLVINAVDAAGVRRIINEEFPKVVELGAQLGRQYAAEDRARDTI